MELILWAFCRVAVRILKSSGVPPAEGKMDVTERRARERNRGAAGVISEQGLYAINAAAMALVTVAFAVSVSRRPPERRKYFVPLVVVPAVATATFGSMSQGVLLIERADGRTIPLGRLLTYLVIYPITTGYIGWTAGLGRRGIGILSGCIATVVAGVGFSWLVPAYSSVGSLVTFGTLLVLGYLLLGPYDRAARTRPGECTLLFGKLRNLLLTLWVLYVLLAMVSRQGLGLLDPFGGVVFGNYLDLLAVVGFGAIVLRAREATAILVDEAAGHADEESADERAPDDRPPGELRTGESAGD